ncbi:MAG TPA: ADOP family duplicated permease [Gemmatimonadaceae bacterium]
MKIPGIRRAVQMPWRTRRALESDVAAELRDHIERRAAQLMAGGMSPEAALVEAQRRFGNYQGVVEECVQVDEPTWRLGRMRMLIDQIKGDVRFAIRSLRRAPAFAAVVIATLAVGIAALTTIFSFIYSVYWRPIPFVDPSRLVAITEQRANHRCCYQGVTKPVAAILARSNRAFVRVTTYEQELNNTLIGNEARQLESLLIDTSFAPTFSLRPQIGRLFNQSDVEARAPVAIISDRFWHSAFGGDSTIVGRRLTIDSTQVTVVGVMPPRFGFPQRTDLWRPRSTTNDAHGEFDDPVGVVGTLRPGVSRSAAEAELQVLAAQISGDRTTGISKTKLSALPEVVDRRAQSAVPMPWVFLGAGALLLLIAAANVMNLFLARTAERKSEIAIRTSIGATRGRIVTQLLTETFMLAIIAGVLGLGGARVLTKVATATLPLAGLPTWVSFDIDYRILGFISLLTLTTTLVVGLTPALDGTAHDIISVLKAGGDGGSVRSGAASSARRGLIIQLALSVVLFVGTGMFVRSYQRMTNVDLGYPGERVVSLTYFPGTDSTRQRSAQSQSNEVATRLAHLPGGIMSAVRSLTSTQLAATPVARSQRDTSPPDFRLIPDRDSTRALSDRDVGPIDLFAVSDSYFATLGLRLIRGRIFNEDDGVQGVPTVVIGEQLASQLWPHTNPIGGLLQRGRSGATFTVVGVVQNVRALRRRGPNGVSIQSRSSAYYSIRQVALYRAETLARWNGSVSSLSATSERIARELDPTMTTRAGVLGNLAEMRVVSQVFASVLGGLAITGISLAVIGLYGLTSYGITQRRRELGVRIALGATSKQVVTLVMTDSVRFVGVGIVVGVLLSLAAGRLVRQIMYEASGVDLSLYVIACAGFAALALLATYLPAMHAARIDPVSALKSD